MKRKRKLITILVIYIDGIVVIGNDMAEIQAHSPYKYLGREFEIKDLEELKYFS